MKHQSTHRTITIEYSLLVFLLSLTAFSLVLSACSQRPDIFTPDPFTPESSGQVNEPTAVLTPTPQLISPPYAAWLDPTLPVNLRNLISEQFTIDAVSNRDQAVLVFSSEPSDQAGSWTYLLVGPLYSRLENIRLSDLEELWKTGTWEIASYNKLLMSEDTKIHIAQFWGKSSSDDLQIVDPENLLNRVWYDTGSLAIIPFEDLEPSYKVISIDNKNPLTPAKDDNPYPFSFPVYMEISDQRLLSQMDLSDLANFNPSKLTTVALTGVTAMVRDTAVIMEEKGILYPGNDIRDILLSVDITHISNEVPFAQDCPPPTSSQDSLAFCSSDSYIELLESVGADIIELSGDHFADHGAEAMLHTLDLYEQHGITIYGGGPNLQSGLDPVTMTHNGNRIAFIGCNGKSDERYATATETNPGASRCDFDWMIQEISQLVQDGYLVIATMQHEEVDSYFPIALQEYDFRRLSEAGASIVSGSQAHHPQGIELSGSRFIHYGLGNLFFDQWYLAQHYPEKHINKDKAFIDIHYIYNGNYINTRFIPLQFIDNARPREMTPEEADLFLLDFFEGSRWNGKWIDLFTYNFYDYPDQ